MLVLAGVLAVVAGVAGGLVATGRGLPFTGEDASSVAVDTTDPGTTVSPPPSSVTVTSTAGTQVTLPASTSSTPATTAATSETPVPSTSSTSTLPGDLGLSVPMARPDCDGGYAVFIGASVTPDEYADEISGYLDDYPGSQYLRTDITCSSLRSRTEDGAIIYAVFFGPFDTFDRACAAASRGPGGSYVKPLDNVSDPDEIPEC